MVNEEEVRLDMDDLDAWFIAGQVWFFNSSVCKTTNPHLYYLSMTYIIQYYITNILPAILYLILLLVAGCIRRRRRHEEEERVRNDPIAHLHGGLSKRELRTLRTFQLVSDLAGTMAGVGVMGVGSGGGVVVPEGSEDFTDGVKKEAGDSSKVDGKGEQSQQEAVSAELRIQIPQLMNEEGNSSSPDASLPTNNQPNQNSTTTTSPLSSNPTTSPTKRPRTQKISKLPSNVDPTCCICFSDFETGDKIRELACKHLFHKQCIDRWLYAAPSEASLIAAGLNNERPDTSSSSISTASSTNNHPQRPVTPPPPNPQETDEERLQTLLGIRPPKKQAHRTCPLCKSDAVSPENRDPLILRALEANEEDEAVLRVVMERSRREALEEEERRRAGGVRGRWFLRRGNRREDSLGRVVVVQSGGQGSSMGPGGAGGTATAAPPVSHNVNSNATRNIGNGSNTVVVWIHPNAPTPSHDPGTSQEPSNNQ
ncbi:hypothetical protein HDV05_003871 [Chytridiales sp. JEL 0842]|nr:hypothetical protein HDV05_003871 [Chytridiales sp. JEL 0842]